MTVPGEDPVHDFVNVPDDARELESDIAAYYRERAARRRRERVEGVFKTRRWRQYGLSGPLVAMVLILVAGVGVLLVTVRPDAAPDRLQQAPLASPDRAVGALGGLLPELSVVVEGTPQDVRSLRPGLLLLAPAGCGCAGVVDALAAQASQYTVRPYLVVTVTSDGEQLAAEVPRTLTVATDPTGRLAAVYQARGVTAVVVRPDGVVLDVVRDVVDPSRVGSRLAELTTSRP